jgi:hypothetical protein
MSSEAKPRGMEATIRSALDIIVLIAFADQASANRQRRHVCAIPTCGTTVKVVFPIVRMILMDRVIYFFGGFGSGSSAGAFVALPFFSPSISVD